MAAPGSRTTPCSARTTAAGRRTAATWCSPRRRSRPRPGSGSDPGHQPELEGVREQLVLRIQPDAVVELARQPGLELERVLLLAGIELAGGQQVVAVPQRRGFGRLAREQQLD